MKQPFRQRLERAIKLLTSSDRTESDRAKSNRADALVVSSNPFAVRSRDTHFPYRPNSDLFYLTGATAQEATLVVNPKRKPAALLLVPPTDPVRKVWEGAQPSLKKLAESVGAELIVTKDMVSSIKALLKGTDRVFTQVIPGTPSFAVRQELAARPADRMRTLPSEFADIENFTGQLRLFKDSHEVAAIRNSAELTAAALREVLPYLRPGVTEREVAAFLDYIYSAHSAAPAFGTIVAAGRSAATLHYHDLKRPLRNGELVLIDTGAEIDMYAADITRTFPVGALPTGALRAVHDTVVAAQEAAIKAVKPGVLLSDVNLAAVKELTRGLKELKVISGNLSTLISNRACRPYFPHGIGHSLGIDVHDVGATGAGFCLQEGMVFTIEPGLYFPKAVGKVPACGVRIEDDVLVTKRGCEVLTEMAAPKSLGEME
jgi:Xaa-Pro aminopeptidase